MHIQWVDEWGIGHRANTDLATYGNIARCTSYSERRKWIRLMEKLVPDDAVQVTCLWCVGDVDRE